MKLQEAAKVKGQKRRVADRSEKPQYTDEEVAKLVDYDYGYLLDMIYYKLESMRDFFLSKHTHCADAKKFAKQMLHLNIPSSNLPIIQSSKNS